METLRTLAINTDGRAIVNRNDLTMGMKQIVRDSSAYYLLGYNSTLTATDGKFHEIKVRVKRPGVQVRARKGYWAFTNEDAKRALGPPQAGDAEGGRDGAGHDRDPVPFPAGPHLDRHRAGQRRQDEGDASSGSRSRTHPATRPRGEAPARMSVTAIAPDGSPYYRGKTTGQRAGDGNEAGADGDRSRLLPARCNCGSRWRARPVEVLDSEVRELSVPDLTSPNVAIATPEVFRARTVREFQQLKSELEADTHGVTRVQPDGAHLRPRFDVWRRVRGADAVGAVAESDRSADRRPAGRARPLGAERAPVTST